MRKSCYRKKGLKWGAKVGRKRVGDENSIAFMKREKKKKEISLKIKPKPKKRNNNKHAKSK